MLAPLATSDRSSVIRRRSSIAGFASFWELTAQPVNFQFFLPQLSLQSFNFKRMKLRGSSILAISKDGSKDKATGGHRGRNERQN